jgi:hypothetical protein
VRIDPHREVAAAVEHAGFHAVAVGQQHRIAQRVGLEADAVSAEHVGPVDGVGDARESLRFALRAQHGPRAVPAFQRGVPFRVVAHHGAQHEHVRNLFQPQPIGLEPPA